MTISEVILRHNYIWGAHKCMCHLSSDCDAYTYQAFCIHVAEEIKQKCLEPVLKVVVVGPHSKSDVTTLLSYV